MDRRGADVELGVAYSPEGVEAQLAAESGRRYVLTLSSNYAGAFRNFRLSITAKDPLGLSERREDKAIQLVAEFLPRSLVALPQRAIITAMALGERPANARGYAQEFYGAEQYDLSQEAKDILWKRLAHASTDSFLVRVREAGTPDSLTVCLFEAAERQGLEIPEWMDLTTESMARVGLSVVGSGVRLRAVRLARGREYEGEASDVRTLADCLMALWDPIGAAPSAQWLERASVIITGEDELRDPGLSSAAERKPTVVVSDPKRARASGPRLLFFTGSEDLSGIVSRVLSR